MTLFRGAARKEAEVNRSITEVFSAFAGIAAIFSAVSVGAADVDPAEVAKKLNDENRACVECHLKPGMDAGKVYDWARSKHGQRGIGCGVCHEKLTDAPAGQALGQYSPVVSPDKCGRCHRGRAEEFKRSKHARTLDIQEGNPWLRGLNAGIERATGCSMCHGSDISSGKYTAENWPNMGIGRKNPDGSSGNCAACHTTHRFSIAEARKPETCGQCHLGRDHPQDEIYFESKHGKRYLAEGAGWNYTGEWKPGADFSAPTCAVCHMSEMGAVKASHDVGERLKWEEQAALTVMNTDHDGDAGRKKMTGVCMQCHSPRWTNNYLTRYDAAVLQYNTVYFSPLKAVMDDLYAKKILTVWPVFDEEIEWAYHEYWRNEGRRARMGSAMMGPDYAWWEGFYDLKKGCQHIMNLADEARRNGHAVARDIPGATGDDLTKKK